MFIFKGMGLEHSPTISIHDCVGLNVLNMNYVYFVTTTCMFWRPVRSLGFGIKSQAPHVTPEYSRIPNPRLLTGLQNIHVSQIPGSSRDSRIYMYPKSLSLHGTPEYTCFPNPSLLTGLQNIHVSQIPGSSRVSRACMSQFAQVRSSYGWLRLWGCWEMGVERGIWPLWSWWIYMAAGKESNVVPLLYIQFSSK